jgi:hypothetical protein
MSSGIDLKQSRFTEHLMRLNALGFNQWIFERGMLFRSETKWWGDRGDRGSLHNGLDLRLYEGDDGTIKTLGVDTKVPIIYEGKIVAVVKDFLGYSLFAAHEIYDKDRRLFSIYGHVAQMTDISIGTLLREGAQIATIAGESPGKVPCHLHLSLAMIPHGTPPKSLTWEVLEKDETVVLLDPMNIIERRRK